MKVLGVYRSDTMEPIAISIPDDLVGAVEKAILERQDLTIGGKVIPNRLVINQDHLFDDIEEYRSVKQLLTPTKQEVVAQRKSWDEMRDEVRQSDWYRKSRKERRGL